MSKKFLKFATEAPHAATARRAAWGAYQYPLVRPTGAARRAPYQVLQGDLSQAHWEVNEAGSASQLYSICNLITRCFMVRTLLSPDRGIQEILQEFKASIFKGQRFSFEDFLSAGYPPESSLTAPERQSANGMRGACESLVQELGGAVATSRVAASHVVLLQGHAS